MTPRQMDARRRIDAIYGDQSHPYWQGDPGATEEMAGYFRVLYPEPEAERSGDAAPLLRGQGAPVPESVMMSFSQRKDVLDRQNPGVTVGPVGSLGHEESSPLGTGTVESRSMPYRTARRRIDAIYGDQSHPYWRGDPGATEEMEGYFRALRADREVEREEESLPKAPLRPVADAAMRDAESAVSQNSMPLPRFKPPVPPGPDMRSNSVPKPLEKPPVPSRETSPTESDLQPYADEIVRKHFESDYFTANVDRLRPLIEEIAVDKAFDPSLIAAFIAVESSFDPENPDYDPDYPGKRQNRASSARGLMQVTRAAAQDAGGDHDRLGNDRYDIVVGVDFLDVLRTRHGATTLEELARFYHGDNPEYLAKLRAFQRAFRERGWR